MEPNELSFEELRIFLSGDWKQEAPYGAMVNVTYSEGHEKRKTEKSLFTLHRDGKKAGQTYCYPLMGR